VLSRLPVLALSSPPEILVGDLGCAITRPAGPPCIIGMQTAIIKMQAADTKIQTSFIRIPGKIIEVLGVIIGILNMFI
jgi:hypothetical protein